MRLPDLLEQVDCLEIRGDLQRDIQHIEQDSRQVTPAAGFVAVRGARVDGHSFVPSLQAAFVVVEREVPVRPGVVLVRVADTRLALAQLAAALRGRPSERLSVVGVTGTNGKTTTTRLIESIGAACGRKIGVIGTAGHHLPGRVIPALHTTPLAPEWQELLLQMADAGCSWVAAEVSSIGLAARRVDATRFAAAIFTNLTRDHLDYHGSMEEYALAKSRLFSELLSPGGAAIFWGEDPAAPGIVGSRSDVTYLDYGISEGVLRVADLRLSPSGAEGRLLTPMGEAPLRLQLLGRHNVLNALAAAGAGLALSAPLDLIVRGLAALPFVEGRLQPVPGPGPTVLVDYAHTDDALRSVLAALREICPGRILTVFGCGGDRDRGKRPLMTRAACQGSDEVIATSDNPRSEAAEAILEDMQLGQCPGVRVEPDRALAIRLAVSLARPGDIVLIAGKGHEQYQEINGIKQPFDDRLIATAALEGR